MFDIAGTVAIVTGALGGIGRVLVKTLLKRSAKGVVLIDVNAGNGAQEFLDSLDEEFGEEKTLFLKIDITDSASVAGAFEQTIDRFGNLDIVVNNAAVLSQDDVESIIKVNLLATVQISQRAFFEHLPKHKSGSEGVILNVASIMGLLPYHVVPTYGAAKHGVVAYTLAMGHEDHYKNYPVRVMALCPGATDTPIIHQMTDYYKSLFDASLFKAFQPPEAFEDALVKVLQDGGNGSIWIAKNNEPAIEYNFKTDIQPRIEKYVW